MAAITTRSTAGTGATVKNAPLTNTELDTNFINLNTELATKGPGTVTSVGGTGTVSGLTLSGTVTSTGNLTLGGTLSVTASNFASQTANTVLAAPNGAAGTPTFRALVAADIPTLNQNTTGTAANVTGTVAVANGGTGATTNTAARTNLGATTVGSNLFTLTNPGAVTFIRLNADNTVSTLNATDFRTAIGAGTSSTTGTVTSVGGTGTVSGLTLSGTVTSTGNLTLGGTLSVAASNFASQTANTVLAAPNVAAGTPTFRALVAADIPTLNQNTTGNAATATALQTARNINGTSFNGSADITTANWGTTRTLTIGNTGKSINGSANVAWTTDEIGAESLHSLGVPRSNLGSPTVREMALFDAQYNNKTELYDIANVFIETSTDNVNWTTFSVSDTNKRMLVGGDSFGGGFTIPYGTAYFRVRLRATSYVYLNALYMYWSSNGHSSTVQIYKKHDSGSWTQHTSSSAAVSAWPGHLYLPFSTIPWHPTGTLGTHFHEVYVVFQPTWNATYPSNGIAFNKMQWWGGYPAGKRNLYGTNELGDASFPAALSAVGAITQNGNQVLHAGNYTSYSPSLTGSGASGTWGINITGSSASTTGSSGSVTGLTLTSSANGINPDSVTQNQLGYNTSVSLFGQTDGGLYSSAYSSSWIHQIYGDFRTGQIAIRGKNSGTWQAWRTVLDSSNYTSYSPSLTGSGASGSWGINITGTAANVTGTVAVANGGTGATTNTAARTNLGATTVGSNLFTLTNPAAVTFIRLNADNTVSTLNATDFRTAIGAGTSSTTGTVTSVSGTGTVSGLTLSGTVTSTGNLTLGGTLSVAASNFASQTANTVLAAPNVAAGTPTFRALVAADIPTLNQNTTGNAATATALQTARNINGVSFNGTADITVADSTKLPLAGGTMTGNLSINNTSPTINLQDTDNMPAFLHCNSNIFYVLRNATANSTTWDSGPNGRHPMVLNLSSGDVTFSGNVTAYSDKRLKKNISVISDPLSKINALVGVSFERLEGQKGIGLVAQNVREVLPEVVTEDKEGYLSVAYGNMVGLLVEAVKELSARVKSLEAR